MIDYMWDHGFSRTYDYDWLLVFHSFEIIRNMLTYSSFPLFCGNKIRYAEWVLPFIKL